MPSVLTCYVHCVKLLDEIINNDPLHIMCAQMPGIKNTMVTSCLELLAFMEAAFLIALMKIWSK